MRRHGWQLPFHPLQVVAVSVFLALGFSFYVFFAPFVGKKLYQYSIMGVYTPLILCSFGLYIWCAAANPADPGVFKTKKYLKTSENGKHTKSKESKSGGELTSSIHDRNAATNGDSTIDNDVKSMDVSEQDLEAESEGKNNSASCSSSFLGVVLFPCTFLCRCTSPREETSQRQMSEDGMFYCSLCEVEVFKYSKHCRVCDKCVDRFDHHCRWLNNCIGKKNYRKFFTLMVFSLLLLILQWSTGIIVLVCCFLDQKRFTVDIISKLGSSFSMVPFVLVVVVCTILAMIATLPLAQLFFFHILLIKKGISTYDYIIALREQEQQVSAGRQSPQMSQISSLTGLTSASSFTTYRHGAWCTPPRLFLEDQFDVVPTDTGSVSSYGKKAAAVEEPAKKKNAAVKISPWTLARLNAEEVSKVAAEARKKSQILQPVPRHASYLGSEKVGSVGGSRRQMARGLDNNRRRNSKRGQDPADLTRQPLPHVLPKAAVKHENYPAFVTSARLAPHQFDAVSSSIDIVEQSPDSSLDSPLAGSAALPGLLLSRSTSDGYDASGGEDSGYVSSRSVESLPNWSGLLVGSNRYAKSGKFKASSSLNLADGRKI
ncbi:hypothetical protein Nepgr_028014 [Nepenthes gracilis]|uniref:S-acyltransferase n=1 Tax=Nepenthes gracilis TaxID=150966 RepID=A0AAD3TBL7_NEPGR|nr:hypothetical protein Nepgr_028014 [Nepenthes gracilis]